MPRAMWNGAISFGLVSVLITLEPATESHDVQSRQVHLEDDGRVMVALAAGGRELVALPAGKRPARDGVRSVRPVWPGVRSLPSAGRRGLAFVDTLCVTMAVPVVFARMPSMDPLPIPCPAERIPDASGPDGFHAVYRAALEQRAVFVTLEGEGPRWRIKADTLTAPGHTVGAGVYAEVREAIIRLVDAEEIRPDSYAGPVYFVLHGVDSEPRARELAAALHAALYGDLEPLARAVPPEA
ncbi:hypothetical protein [Streptomyces sp. NPDC055055]